MPKNKDTDRFQVYLPQPVRDRFDEFTRRNPLLSKSKAAAILIDQALSHLEVEVK